MYVMKRKYEKLDSHIPGWPDTVFYGLNCVPQNLYVKDLTSIVIAFWGGSLMMSTRFIWGHEGGSLMRRKDSPSFLLPPSPLSPCKHPVKARWAQSKKVTNYRKWAFACAKCRTLGTWQLHIKPYTKRLDRTLAQLQNHVPRMTPAPH